MTGPHATLVLGAPLDAPGDDGRPVKGTLQERHWVACEFPERPFDADVIVGARCGKCLDLALAVVEGRLPESDSAPPMTDEARATFKCWVLSAIEHLDA